MAWMVELSEETSKQLGKLDQRDRRRLLDFVRERLAKLDNPRSLGRALSGPGMSGLWRYRVGSYRIICRLEDKRLVVVVVRVGHRREIYR